MNKTFFNVILVTAGAAIGSLVTWKVVETKYARISQEEIDSVKDEYKRIMDRQRKEVEMYRRMHTNVDDAEEEETVEVEAKTGTDENTEEHKQEIIDYSNITRSYRSSDDEADEPENNEEGVELDEDEVPYVNAPYVIPPEEFCGIPGYSGEPLDYFADGVLADGWGVKMDLDETIGEDSVNHFGEYVDDIVYVRDEAKEIDYEVTRDPRTYDEAVRTSPNPYYGNED